MWKSKICVLKKTYRIKTKESSKSVTTEFLPEEIRFPTNQQMLPNIFLSRQTLKIPDIIRINRCFQPVKPPHRGFFSVLCFLCNRAECNGCISWATSNSSGWRRRRSVQAFRRFYGRGLCPPPTATRMYSSSSFRRLRYLIAWMCVGKRLVWKRREVKDPWRLARRRLNSFRHMWSSTTLMGKWTRRSWWSVAGKGRICAWKWRVNKAR